MTDHHRRPSLYPLPKAVDGHALRVRIPQAQYEILLALAKSWTMSRTAVLVKLLHDYEQKQAK